MTPLRRVVVFWPLATTCPKLPASGATATACGTRPESTMASASSEVRVGALPAWARTPPEVVAPGVTNSRLLPRPWICEVTLACTPWPMDIRAITAPTPMIMPSMVSAARSLLAPRARRATRTLSPGSCRRGLGRRRGRGGR